MYLVPDKDGRSRLQDTSRHVADPFQSIRVNLSREATPTLGNLTKSPRWVTQAEA
jgi:hypothetical protein